MIQSVDVKGSTPEEIDIFLEDNIKSFFKDYDASLDRKVLAAMMKIVKERVPAENLPDIYKKVDKSIKAIMKSMPPMYSRRHPSCLTTISPPC